MRCLVTGASRGLGLAISQHLAKQGHEITLSARNLEKLNIIKQSLGPQHDIWPLDFNDLKSVENNFGAPRNLNEYDAFINCCGISNSKLLALENSSKISEILRVNLEAPILLAKNLVKNMIKSKSKNKKHIVFVSSLLASRAVAGSAVYAASKGGIESFAKSLGKEVGRKNIMVNVVAPGLCDTDMGRMGNQNLLDMHLGGELIDPMEVARAVEFLLNSRSVAGVLRVDEGGSL